MNKKQSLGERDVDFFFMIDFFYVIDGGRYMEVMLFEKRYDIGVGKDILGLRYDFFEDRNRDILMLIYLYFFFYKGEMQRGVLEYEL